MRLEPMMWDALEEISKAHGVSVNNVCTMIASRTEKSSLTSSTRVFILEYFRRLSDRPNGNRTQLLEEILG